MQAWPRGIFSPPNNRRSVARVTCPANRIVAHPSCCGMSLTTLLLFLFAPYGLCAKAKIPFLEQSAQPLTPNGQCSYELRQLEHGDLRQVVDDKPHLSGHWVSTRCEVLPGPRFLLRAYQFDDSGSFQLHSYRYADDDCSKPMEAFIAEGMLKHISPTSAVPGADQAGVELQRVQVVPYTAAAALRLRNALQKNCFVENNFEWPLFHIYQPVQVYKAITDDSLMVDGMVDDIDCLHALNFSVSEMSLLRMDEVQVVDANFFVKRLHLGLPVWDAALNVEKLPSHFQTPLMNADEVSDCKTCQRVVNAHRLSPPILRARSKRVLPTEHLLQGDWLSTECESHVHGMYVHRQVSFHDNHFAMRQRHFEDAMCRKASHTLAAIGRFIVLDRPTSFDRGVAIKFMIERVLLTPESQSTTRSLRFTEHCGPKRLWRRGHVVDLTKFGGCQPLGISVPTASNDVVVLEENDKGALLFSGDFATVEYSHEQLPTSLRPPLRKCDQLFIQISLIAADGPATPSDREFYQMWRSTASKSQFPFFLIVMCVISLIFR